MKFGEQLMIFLRQKNISQIQLAEMMGIHPNTVSQTINYRDPSYSFLKKLGELFPDFDFQKTFENDSTFPQLNREMEEENINSKIQFKIQQVKILIEELEELTHN